MHGNRNNRNPQQLRALIQNMGRSIDEARTKRLGPAAASQSPQPDFRLGSAQQSAQPQSQSQSQSSSPMPAPAQSSAHPVQRSDPQRPGSFGETPKHAPGNPPVRSANEMFEGGTPRLKARPKRAS